MSNNTLITSGAHYETIDFYERPSDLIKTASYALDIVIGGIALPLFSGASFLALPFLTIGTIGLTTYSFSKYMPTLNCFLSHEARVETLKKTIIIAAAYCFATATSPTLLVAGIIGKIAVLTFTLIAMSVREKKEWQSPSTTNNNPKPCITRINHKGLSLSSFSLWPYRTIETQQSNSQTSSRSSLEQTPPPKLERSLNLVLSLTYNNVVIKLPEGRKETDYTIDSRANSCVIVRANDGSHTYLIDYNGQGHRVRLSKAFSTFINYMN